MVVPAVAAFSFYLVPRHAVVDLPRQKPTAADFVRLIVREMKIRFYCQESIKTYRNDLARLLRWFGNSAAGKVNEGRFSRPDCRWS